MAKPLNHLRRIKALEQTKTKALRNVVAHALALRTGSFAGRHPDKKKQANRNACRGKHDE